MVKLYAMTCGWLTMGLGSLLRGESGKIKIPVPCYLVEHPRGNVVVDTGLNLLMQTDADLPASPCVERMPQCVGHEFCDDQSASECAVEPHADVVRVYIEIDVQVASERLKQV